MVDKKSKDRGLSLKLLLTQDLIRLIENTAITVNHSASKKYTTAETTSSKLKTSVALESFIVNQHFEKYHQLTYLNLECCWEIPSITHIQIWQ